MEDKKEQDRQQKELRERIYSYPSAWVQHIPTLSVTNIKEVAPMEVTKRSSRVGNVRIIPGGQRYARMELPRYDGLSDPLGWLTHCEYFFHHHHTPDMKKIGITFFHLEADAQLWFLKWERDNSDSSSSDIKEECNVRFIPILRSTRVGELSKIRQTGSVDEYQRKFVQLLSRADSLTQDQEVELFISGLHEHIATFL